VGRTGTYQVDMLPKVQVNIVLSDHNVEKTLDTIIRAAKRVTLVMAHFRLSG